MEPSLSLIITYFLAKNWCCLFTNPCEQASLWTDPDSLVKTYWIHLSKLLQLDLCTEGFLSENVTRNVVNWLAEIQWWNTYDMPSPQRWQSCCQKLLNEIKKAWPDLLLPNPCYSHHLLSSRFLCSFIYSISTYRGPTVFQPPYCKYSNEGDSVVPSLLQFMSLGDFHNSCLIIVSKKLQKSASSSLPVASRIHLVDLGKALELSDQCLFPPTSRLSESWFCLGWSFAQPWEKNESNI